MTNWRREMNNKMYYFSKEIWRMDENEWIKYYETLTNIKIMYNWFFWLYYIFLGVFSCFLYFFFFFFLHHNIKTVRIFFRARFDWLYVVLSLMDNAGVLSVFAFLLTNMENLVLGKYFAFQMYGCIFFLCGLNFFFRWLNFDRVEVHIKRPTHTHIAHTQEMRRKKKKRTNKHTK